MKFSCLIYFESFKFLSFDKLVVEELEEDVDVSDDTLRSSEVFEILSVDTSLVRSYDILFEASDEEIDAVLVSKVRDEDELSDCVLVDDE